jgi:hypothetical protein
MKPLVNMFSGAARLCVASVHKCGRFQQMKNHQFAGWRWRCLTVVCLMASTDVEDEMAPVPPSWPCWLELFFDFALAAELWPATPPGARHCQATPDLFTLTTRQHFHSIYRVLNRLADRRYHDGLTVLYNYSRVGDRTNQTELSLDMFNPSMREEINCPCPNMEESIVHICASGRKNCSKRVLGSTYVDLTIIYNKKERSLRRKKKRIT